MAQATGIHVYIHRKNGGIILKLAYNFRQGMQAINANKYRTDCEISAVGWNGFTLAIHYRRKF